MILALFILLAIAGICLLIWRDVQVDQMKARKREKYSVPPFKVGSAIVVLGVLGTFWAFTSITYVSASEMAVVENTTTGSLKALGPGLHMWPFDPKVVPFVSNVSTYSIIQDFDIGAGAKTNKDGIQADSSSPGRPVVYFHNRIKVTPNKDKLVELHRRFGPGYINSWVRQVAESATKTVQGQNTLDYVGNNRGEFQQKVRDELEMNLRISVGDAWVYVNQVIVMDYDFDDATNAALKNIADAQFKVTQAVSEAALAEQKKNITETNAKAEAIVITTKATADATAKTTAATAESFRLTTEADGQAEAITKIQNALASSPTYIELQQVQKWNGTVPQFVGGTNSIPFINLQPATTPTATPTSSK